MKKSQLGEIPALAFDTDCSLVVGLVCVEEEDEKTKFSSDGLDEVLVSTSLDIKLGGSQLG